MENNIKNILITGGAGFIGGNLIRRLLKKTNFNIFNLDKLNYASYLESINEIVNNNSDIKKRYKFFKCDLSNKLKTEDIINKIKPDIIVHFAAESHVDKYIDNPSNFIKSKKYVDLYTLWSTIYRIYIVLYFNNWKSILVFGRNVIKKSKNKNG